ncbi:MAG TPA: sigma-70 family RNA polymerase sigma factor, partial [Chitinophagaceae bacterium]|nr:sigma-70 family RNA polymerase sigma factor [Chitinophagaceae bacterium]
MSHLLNHTDAELTGLLATDQANSAFTELYNRYWKKLLTLAYSKLKVQALAEEVVQDVFMNLWNRRQRLTIRHSFHTYIASSVKYEILAKIVQQKKRKELDEKRPDSIYSASHNPVNDWIDYEITRQNIEATVQQLPEKCRLV